MAFMAAGNQPNRGPYGRIVTDALQVRAEPGSATANPPGFLHNPNASPHGPMYGHGFATLFLAEAYGMVHDQRCAERSQREAARGGQAHPRQSEFRGRLALHARQHDADLSVTICQIMALRRPRNAGIAVPNAKVDKCVEYVKGCQDRMRGLVPLHEAGRRRQAAPPALRPHRRRRGAPCTVPASTRDRRSTWALNFLMAFAADGRRLRAGRDMHYFYGHYYAVQAMWTAGGDTGPTGIPPSATN